MHDDDVAHNDGITLTFVGPSIPFIGGKNAINDNSVAFMLQYRSFRMLLPLMQVQLQSSASSMEASTYMPMSTF